MSRKQFACPCGDEWFPLVKTDDEESVWAQCGLRIEPLRERAQQIEEEQS